MDLPPDVDLGDPLPELVGPDEYHVFVDSYKGDDEGRDAVQECVGRVEAKLTFMNKFNPQSHKSPDRNVYISGGYLRCQKVVALVNAEYLGDDNYYFQHQLKHIAMKSQARGPYSVIFVLVGLSKDKLERKLYEHGLNLFNHDDKSRAKVNLKPHELQYVSVESIKNIDEKSLQLKRLLLKELIATEADLPTGEGTTLAWSYYYGYVNLVAPVFDGKAKSFELYKPNRMARRIFVLCPESGYSPPELLDIHSGLVDSKHKINLCIHRAGKKSRDYHNTIYTLVENGTEYHAAIEVCGTLVTFFETYAGTRMSEDQAAHTVHEFFCSLNAILRFRLKGDHDVFVLLFYKDKHVPAVDVKEMIVKNIKDYIEEDRTREHDTGMRHSQIEKRPTSAYAKDHVGPLGAYSMARTESGLAVIITNEKFTKGSCLKDRHGAKSDSDNLAEIWRKQGFSPIVHHNLNGQEMSDLAEKFRCGDYKQHDAFIFCVSTHGKKGYVCGTDGEKVPVLTELVAPFYAANCPSLSGKPKMFFIQACQNDDMPTADPDDCNVSNSPYLKLMTEFCKQVDMETTLTPDCCDIQLTETAENILKSNMEDLAEAISQVKICDDPSSGRPELENTMAALVRDSSGLLESDPVSFSNKRHERTPDIVPREKDVLVSYSCLPGQKSQRHQQLGSLYVRALKQEIMLQDSATDFDVLLKCVSRRVNFVVTIYRAMLAAAKREHVKELIKCVDDGPQFPFHVFPTEKQLFVKGK